MKSQSPLRIIRSVQPSPHVVPQTQKNASKASWSTLAKISRLGHRLESAAAMRSAAEYGAQDSAARLPHFGTIQQAFGKHDLSGVRASIGQPARSTARRLEADAFTFGERIGFKDRQPDVRTAAHEAAHVVQQRSGIHRSMAEGVGRDGDTHERHADSVADAVVTGQSAEPLLDRYFQMPRLSLPSVVPSPVLQLARTKQTAGHRRSLANARSSASRPRKTEATRATPRSAPATGGVKKPHRYRPGTVALREMRQARGNVRLPRGGKYQDVLRELKEDFSSLEFQLKVRVAALLNEVDDTVELASWFPDLGRAFNLRSVEYTGLGTPRAAIVCRVNPTFEIQLATGGKPIEMRGVGSSGGPFQTHVEWAAQTLKLGANSYTVGHTMHAYPLSSDHPSGTLSTADTDQTFMNQLPSVSNRLHTGSGSGPFYYIKGHLLNDNIGGIANQQNLYPITHEANGQHKNYVEQYIKYGVANGYVYEYNVTMVEKSVGHAPGFSGTIYYVNSDLEFDFARLDATKTAIPATRHKGVIQSIYGTTGGEPFTRSTEYATDYTGGKYANPIPVGAEGVLKHVRALKLGSNVSLTTSLATFVMAGPSGSSLGFVPVTITQTLASPPTAPLARLSLRNTALLTVIARYSSLVAGWSPTQIGAWIGALNSKNIKTWTGVQSEAIANGLLPVLATSLFDKSLPYMNNVTIYGAP